MGAKIAAPRRPVRAVDPESRLRARAREVVGERVAFFDRGELDGRRLARHVNVLPHAPRAVGQFAQPVADEALGLPDELFGDRFDHVDAVVVVELAHALLRDVVGGHLRLHVERRHAGIAHDVQKRLDDVAAHDAPFHDLEALGLETFLEALARVWREAAGIDGADIRHVDEIGDEPRQAATVMDWRDQVDVRGMQRRRVGVVEEVHVVLEDPGIFEKLAMMCLTA